MTADPVAPFSWSERIRVVWTVEPSLRRSFLTVRLGHVYMPVGWAELDSDSLRVRREPLLVPKNATHGDRVHGDSAWKYENPIERFFPIVDGVQDRRFRHTPHFRLLEVHSSRGRREYWGDYAKLVTVRARLQGRRLDPQFVRAKVDRLCATFDSIRTRGYMKGEFQNRPITVLEHPLQSRFGTYEPQNWEVFDGHHRAASVALLGDRNVRVLVVRPIRVRRFDLAEEVPWDDAHWPNDDLEPRDSPGKS